MFTQDRDFHQTFQDAPHGSAILNERTMKFSGCSARECDFERKNDEMFRMLRMGARFSSKFSGCSAQECDFPLNFQDAPRGSAIFLQIFRMLRTGARFSSEFSGCSARERDLLQNFQDAPRRSAIFFKILRTLRTGARFSSQFSRRSAWERDFLQNKTTLNGAFSYRIGIGFIP